MRDQIIIAGMAGVFGLVPVLVQWLSSVAARRSRNHHLSELKAELEFLERWAQLSQQLDRPDTRPSAAGEVVPITRALEALLTQYEELPHPAKQIVGGHREPRRLAVISRPQRALLLYRPATALGWLLHTGFYVLLLMMTPLLLQALLAGDGELIFGLLILLGIPMAILSTLARRLDGASVGAPLPVPDPPAVPHLEARGSPTP